MTDEYAWEGPVTEADVYKAGTLAARSLGGRTSPDNCQMLCKAHNRSKANRWGVSGLGNVPSYTPAMSSLEERMEDFAPSVIVKRDGVEVTIPMDEFMADAEESKPDETPA